MPPISIPSETVEACQAFKNAGVVIETIQGDIAPANPKYKDLCEALNSAARAYQEHFKAKPSVWNVPLINQAADFAKNHGFTKVTLVTPQTDPTGARTLSVIGARTLRLGLLRYMSDAEDLAVVLNHEYGHIKDKELFPLSVRQSSSFRQIFEAGLLTIQNIRDVIPEYFNLLRSKLGPGEQKEFDQLKEEVIGDLSRAKTLAEIRPVYSFVVEVLRYGSEKHDKREKEVFLRSQEAINFENEENKAENTTSARVFEAGSWTLPYNGKTVGITFHRRSARFMELDLWEQAKQMGAVPKDADSNLDQKMLRFCRLCIVAASRLFPI